MALHFETLGMQHLILSDSITVIISNHGGVRSLMCHCPIASSSSSSPDTSAFSCPTLAISCAKSCSSVSDTAFGCRGGILRVSDIDGGPKCVPSFLQGDFPHISLPCSELNR